MLAYNHASWYVDEVLSQAAAYRRTAPTSPRGDRTWDVPANERWLVELRGFPGERCDERIVGDVLTLARAYRLAISDCFGGSPHALRGEHPLGLAIDASPRDGDWRRTLKLATDFGWSPSCAAAGCPGRGPFRVILYNGYPGHGDPAHTSSPHIHLSWAHAPAAPYTRASRVRVLTQPRRAAASRGSRCRDQRPIQRQGGLSC